KPRSPTPVSTCCALPARERNPVRDNASSSHCGRSSNRSTTPSRPSSTSNATEDAPSPESPHVSYNASSPSPPPSGTTTEPTSRSCDHCPHTTTDPWNYSSRSGKQIGLLQMNG